MSARWPDSRRVEWALLLIICAVGAGLRLWRIGSVPPGLYEDEAYYGLDAANTARGDWQLYYPANNGREPLYIYLAALSIRVLGSTPLAERLPAAFLGILFIPAVYALGRALFGRRVGALAAVLAAGSLWAIAFSRIGLRATTLPFTLAITLATAARGWRLRDIRWLMLAGALGGLCAYTYIAARLLPLPLLALGLFWFLARRASFPAWRALLAFALPALLIAAPLLLYAVQYPDIYLGRVGQVSVLSGPSAGTRLWQNLRAVLLMFTVQGDLNARHNWPGRPVFDALIGIAFVFGLGLALWRVVRRRHLPSALSLLFFAAMLLPTLLSDKAPHFLRAIGVLPTLFLFPALSLDALRRVLPNRLRPALVIGLPALALFLSARVYFGPYAASAETRYYFQTAARTLAEHINRAARPPDIYLDKRLWDSFAAVRFLLDDAPAVRVWDTSQPLTLNAARESEILLWPHANPRAELAFLPPGRLIRAEAGPLTRGDEETQAYSLYTIYHLSPAMPAPMPLAQFERDVILQSAHTALTPAGVQLDLVWAAGPDWAADGVDYHVFVQWIDAGEVVAQDDGPLARGLYPTPWWRAGDVVFDSHFLDLPTALSPTAQLMVGVYAYSSGQRLRVLPGSADALRLPAPSP